MRFDTLLIANRGEIALRIMTTARRLGLRTVAVYSDADAEAKHVREADLAVHIGASDSTASYRNIQAIIDACQRSGAQAVHPGYGFLSENAEFARAVVDANLVFVGPSAKVIDLMGNKLQAKLAMEAAGVPTVPGARIKGIDQDIAALAKQVGYPVIFKATAGGGGRGMRIAEDETVVIERYTAARSEAQNSFGSDEIIIERAIEHGRHIEIQVLCDEHGNCIHLGERDCSMQRRFQKVIEEAPSPAVTPALREAMGCVARKACESIGYVGVGTLEFLLDQDGAFYFMEMNTRLQVEHGVTELITGLDLVEQQINVAQGQALAFRQENVTFQGHAIELRVCAEDPYAGFIPQVGRVERWRAPKGVRVDTYLEDGTQITPFYDSMVAKLLVHAANREHAIQKLSLACSKTVLLGVKNNLSFLRHAINHPIFQKGKATTRFLGNEDIDSALWRNTQTFHATVVGAFVLGRVLDGSAGKERKGLSLRPQCLVQMQLSSQMPQEEQLQRVWIRPVETGFQVSLEVKIGDDLAERESHSVNCSFAGAGKVICTVDGIRRELEFVQPDASTVWVQDEVNSWKYTRLAAQVKEDGFVNGLMSVRAPMTGTVISVAVNLGEKVEANQTLLVLESMKMEMPISISLPGIVGEISANQGQQISAGQHLMEITQL
ncbi:acetyl-CoA carboxylase biotin carboxylase subunit 1 [Advenella kashmirensis WT001]|uniref:Acetyl-CoA carboxylase biotin carboxylase subunit 1 n=1 Tax=Advenella kashmirensis (strain DSM 17095 / LMG 22695 / WT001) TaxID=1036672 RepID=I3UCW3_ADVKW|nr:biotin carboxylase N-terminal domain-containing protein [Advenella kashmirensis]AFK62851.1 acetyl-CoA carboxylase biotin carboxylase subunit 1 [Advenella kashmirensis WT001]